MKEICVLGAGRAGVSFIERIKEKCPQCKVKFIDKNRCYFDKKEFISTLSVKGCFDFSQWAQDKGVEFILGAVERINPKRRKIYFKEREPIDFEALVIAAGVISKKLPLKGEHREGFFYLSSIDPFKIKDLLKISQEVTVCALTVLGIKLAIALSSIGKEVKVIADNWDFLAGDKDKVVSFLESKGISVYLGYAVEEAIGEGVVRAVKLSPLKVISSQIVFAASAFLPNRDFFDEPVEIKDVFFSNYQDLYFLGDVSSQDVTADFFFRFNYEDAQRQAFVLADYIIEGRAADFERKVVEEKDKKDIVDEMLKLGR